MKINITDAEKTALANFLAEKRTKMMANIIKEMDPDIGDNYFKHQFKYYEKILKNKEDNDY